MHERAIDGTYTREQCIVRQHCGIQEGNKREEDGAQQELIDVVVPGIKPVA